MKRKNENAWGNWWKIVFHLAISFASNGRRLNSVIDKRICQRPFAGTKEKKSNFPKENGKWRTENVEETQAKVTKIWRKSNEQQDESFSDVCWENYENCSIFRIYFLIFPRLTHQMLTAALRRKLLHKKGGKLFNRICFYLEKAR